MTKKKNEKVAAVATKKVWVNIFNTNYHRYRHWVKYILAEGKVNCFRFVKNEIGWTGKLAVDKTEVDKAKKVLADYKAKNTNTVDMWWN